MTDKQAVDLKFRKQKYA